MPAHRLPQDQHAVRKLFSLPPALVRELERLIPHGQRSRFVRDAIARQLKRHTAARKEREDG